MRGSNQISSKSEISVPTTVNRLNIITILPAKYISWFINALNSSGPVVGIPNTTEVITEPETICGRTQPMLLTTGLSATRTGYLRSNLTFGTPLARAVTT